MLMHSLDLLMSKRSAYCHRFAMEMIVMDDGTFDVYFVRRLQALRKIAAVNYCCCCLASDTNQLEPLNPLNTVAMLNDVMYKLANRLSELEIQLRLEMKEKFSNINFWIGFIIILRIYFDFCA